MSGHKMVRLNAECVAALEDAKAVIVSARQSVGELEPQVSNTETITQALRHFTKARKK